MEDVEGGVTDRDGVDVFADLVRKAEESCSQLIVVEKRGESCKSLPAFGR
jgi:hypothetical protein